MRRAYSWRLSDWLGSGGRCRRVLKAVWSVNNGVGMLESA